MTKINSNGQLEWTFEELDLDGAIQELLLEERENLVARAQLHKLWDKIEFRSDSPAEWDSLALAVELLANRFQVISSVVSHLQLIRKAGL